MNSFHIFVYSARYMYVCVDMGYFSGGPVYRNPVDIEDLRVVLPAGMLC